MPLDRNRLTHVHLLPDGGCTAQCPVCQASGGDRRGVHLRLFPNGAFACVAYPGDSFHRRQIWAVAGEAARPGATWFKVARHPRPTARRAAFLEDIEALKPRIFASPWPPDAIPDSSPAYIPREPASQAACILRLFHPSDTIWIGFLRDSGSQFHARNFRPAREWLETEKLPPAPRICTATFVPGVIRRCQRTMRVWRFLVVEADAIDLPSQGAILRWLSARLKLRAIVHSGGRSLHGWFDCPNTRDLADLRIILPALSCDPALFNPVQPVRLPGWRRPDNGNLPRLLYLAL